jgi:hypothetical protein
LTSDGAVPYKRRKSLPVMCDGSSRSSVLDI